jgi:hypothetical protein
LLCVHIDCCVYIYFAVFSIRWLTRTSSVRWLTRTCRSALLCVLIHSIYLCCGILIYICMHTNTFALMGRGDCILLIYICICTNIHLYHLRGARKTNLHDSFHMYIYIYTHTHTYTHVISGGRGRRACTTTSTFWIRASWFEREPSQCLYMSVWCTNCVCMCVWLTNVSLCLYISVWCTCKSMYLRIRVWKLQRVWMTD